MPEEKRRLEVTKVQAKILCYALYSYEYQFRGTNVLDEVEQLAIKELRHKLDITLSRLLS